MENQDTVIADAAIVYWSPKRRRIRKYDVMKKNITGIALRNAARNLCIHSANPFPVESIPKSVPLFRILPHEMGSASEICLPYTFIAYEVRPLS